MPPDSPPHYVTPQVMVFALLTVLAVASAGYYVFTELRAREDISNAMPPLTEFSARVISIGTTSLRVRRPSTPGEPRGWLVHTLMITPKTKIETLTQNEGVYYDEDIPLSYSYGARASSSPSFPSPFMSSPGAFTDIGTDEQLQVSVVEDARAEETLTANIIRIVPQNVNAGMATTSPQRR